MAPARNYPMCENSTRYDRTRNFWALRSRGEQKNATQSRHRTRLFVYRGWTIRRAIPQSGQSVSWFVARTSLGVGTSRSFARAPPTAECPFKSKPNNVLTRCLDTLSRRRHFDRPPKRRPRCASRALRPLPVAIYASPRTRPERLKASRPDRQTDVSLPQAVPA
jgi:hypothetical protein